MASCAFGLETRANGRRCIPIRPQVVPCLAEDTRPQEGPIPVHPISAGRITDWEALEALLDNILYQKVLVLGGRGALSEVIDA